MQGPVAAICFKSSNVSHLQVWGRGDYMSTTNISQVLHSRTTQLVPTDTKESLISTDTNRGKMYDNDHLFEQLSDLVNVQWRPWYCKQFYRLGKDTVLRLASIARADAKSNPRGYFSTLLKNQKTPAGRNAG